MMGAGGEVLQKGLQRASAAIGEGGADIHPVAAGDGAERRGSEEFSHAAGEL